MGMKEENSRIACMGMKELKYENSRIGCMGMAN